MPARRECLPTRKLRNQAPGEARPFLSGDRVRLWSLCLQALASVAVLRLAARRSRRRNGSPATKWSRFASLYLSLRSFLVEGAGAFVSTQGRKTNAPAPLAQKTFLGEEVGPYDGG